MATPAKTNTPATPKAKKPPVAVITRVTEQLKRAALSGKLSAEELDKIAALAGSLKVFVSS